MKQFLRTHYEHAAVLGIAIVALVLRLSHVERMSIWYDEAFSYYFARQPFGEMLHGLRLDVHPPLYFILLHFWLKVASTTTWLRLFSVFVGLCSLAAAYRGARKLFPQPLPVLVLLFLAVSPLHIHYSQEIRMYSLLALLSYGLYSIAPEVLARPSFKNWSLLVIFSVLSLYTHYYALFIIFGVFVFIFAEIASSSWNRRRLYFPYVLALAAIVLLYLPWLGTFFTHSFDNVLAGVHAMKPGTFSARLLSEHFFEAMLGLTPWLPLHLRVPIQPITAYFGFADLFAFSLILGALFITGIVVISRNRTLWRFFLCALVLPVALTLLHVKLQGRFYARAYIVYLPLVFASVAAGILALRNRYLMLCATLFLCAFLLFSAKRYLDTDVRDVTSDAQRYLIPQLKPTDAVVHVNPFSYLPFLYYDPVREREYLVDSAKVTYIVRVTAARETLLQRPEQLARFESVWVIISDWSFKSPEETFPQLRLWLPRDRWSVVHSRAFRRGIKWLYVEHFERFR